ncbi:TIGR02285 family protein [Pseudoalteromonas denitrificans]|uniref:TIGR02285 family protein n=1 Tax=Pseudoalteromonas denitrificans TaxID=43656 RepID=UPI0015A7311E|nr:TIGR02285 family protein [Pseudoalteromonas denitrificans]
MKLLFNFIFFIFIGFSIESLSNTITWQVNHAPPVTILKGEYKDQGFLDKILELIISELPQYRHEIIVSSMARSIFDLKKQKNVCLPALFATDERKRYMTFSKSSIAHPSHRIIFNNNKILPFEKTIALDDLLSQEDYTLGLDKGRSFGNKIDAIINKYSSQTNIHLQSSDSPNQLLQMVKIGRIDYTIAYPFKVSYYNKYNHLNKNNFKQYKMLDASQYVIGRVACPKNPWGEKVIADIDVVLKNIKSSPLYFKKMGSWWENEANSPEFIKFYTEVFLKN